MTGSGLILAAPASGSGKTLITAGLACHLRRQGMRVAAAKAGPDFIDPTFLAAATNRVCPNLDLWGMRPATIAGLIAELQSTADLVLCEGVMGLFDGTGADGEAGSTAALAQVTGWPVVLIVDARGQGASVAALLRGFASHSPLVPISGVIFNRVASTRHGALLASAVGRHLPNLARIGALPFDRTLELRSRHLGLIPADEAGNVEMIINRCRARVAAAFDIDRLLGLARSSLLEAIPAGSPIPPLGQRIAVARDHAFCFAYPTLLEAWRRQGAELAFFSPLADEPPDPAADSVYLPGGYPELWAGRLAGSERFAGGLRRAAADRKPVYGECGGYMVLGDALVDATGQSWRMTGLLRVVTSFAERHLHLGYRRATLLGDTPLGPLHARFRGHEFHYATLVQKANDDPLFALADAAGSELGADGLRRGSVFGSFIHLLDREPET